MTSERGGRAGTMSTKIISTPVLLSIAAGGVGIPGVTLSDLHEAIEHLLGEPVWTHQLASIDPWNKARTAIIAQHPAFESIDGTAFKSACQDQPTEVRTRLAIEWFDAGLATIGADSLAVAKGIGQSPEDAQSAAIENLRDVAGGRPVIVVTPTEVKS